VVLAVFVLANFTENAWCAVGQTPQSENLIRPILKDLGEAGQSIFTAGSKNRGFEKKYQEWQSLTPQQRDTMRHRMNQLNQMPPQDRQHFQRLFNKWQKLTPSERQQIERELDNWDSLPPQERESIRRRFQ
jgi:hypothetical protein